MVVFVSKCIPKINKVPDLSFEKQNNCKGQYEKNFAVKCEQIFRVQILIRYNSKFDHPEYSNTPD